MCAERLHERSSRWVKVWTITWLLFICCSGPIDDCFGRWTSAPFPSPLSEALIGGPLKGSRAFRKLLLCVRHVGSGLSVYQTEWLFLLEPEWRQLQNELSPKNLDWWNLVRGLIGLKDRSKRCLYWLDCFFLALESFANFHLMAGLVVRCWLKLHTRRMITCPVYLQQANINFTDVSTKSRSTVTTITLAANANSVCTRLMC